MPKQPAALSADDIIQRYTLAAQRIEAWQDALSTVYRWCLPQYDPYHRDGVGSRRGQEVFDATAPLAFMDLAGDLQFGLTPPNEPWARFEVEPAVRARLQLSKSEELGLREALDEQAELLFEFVRRSNFDTQIHEAYLDLVASTGALLVQENDDPHDPLRFQAVPIGEFVPERGPYGTIETNYRAWAAPARELARMWPDGTFTDAVKQLQEREPTSPVEILEATIYNPATRKWDYTVLERDAKHVVLRDTFDRNPWVVFRWSVAPGEILGRGPGLQVASDVMTLNTAVKLTLENATWAIVGAYTSTDYGVTNMNVLELQPGIIIPVEPGSGIVPIQRSGDFNIAQAMIADLRQSVRETLLRVNLPSATGAVKSATEFAARVEEAQRRIGPPFTRVAAELLLPLVQSIRSILLKQGLLEPIEVVDERDIRIVPVAPLAQLARQTKAARALQALAQVGGIFPNETQFVVQPEETVEWFLEQQAFPAALLRTAEEREALIAQQQQQQAAAALAAAAGGAPSA